MTTWLMLTTRGAPVLTALLLAGCASDVRGDGGSSDGGGGGDGSSSEATAVHTAASGTTASAASVSSASSGSGGGTTVTGVTLPAETAWAQIVEGTLVDEVGDDPRAVAFGVDVGADGAVAVAGLDATGSGGAVKSRFLYWDASGALLHDSATPDSNTEVLNMGATDVSVSPGGIVVSGVGFLEPGTPGYFTIAVDPVSSGSGGFMDAAPGGLRDVSTSFGPNARHVLAVAHGGVTDFGMRAVNSDPDWEATEPLGEALGAAVGPDGTVVLAGEQLDGDDFMGPFVSAWADGELLWSTVYEPSDFAPSAVVVAADGRIYVSGTTAFHRATIAAYEPDGVLRWSRDVEDADGFDLTATSIALLPDGQILLGGFSGFGEGGSSFVRKYDTTGEALWQRDFSSDGSGDVTSVVLWDIAAGVDGRIAVAGYVGRESNEDAMFVAVLDP